MSESDNHNSGNVNESGLGRQTINIDRLTHTTPCIPLLVGFKNNAWIGIDAKAWMSLLDSYFAEEGIISDSEKLRLYNRFIDDKAGFVTSLINATPELLNARTWDDFKENLSCCLNPLSSVHCFDTYINLMNIRWDNKLSLPEYLTESQKVIQDFFDSALSQFGVEFSDEQRKLILFSNLYANAKPSFHKVLKENFDISNSVPKQIQSYLGKSQSLNTGRLASCSSKTSDFDKQCSVFATQSISNNLPNMEKAHYNKYSNSNVGSLNAVREKQINYKLFCKNCESLGHATNQCIFSQYYTFCNQSHLRGSSFKCRNSTWNPFSNEAKSMIKVIDYNSAQNVQRCNRNKNAQVSFNKVQFQSRNAQRNFRHNNNSLNVQSRNRNANVNFAQVSNEQKPLMHSFSPSQLRREKENLNSSDHCNNVNVVNVETRHNANASQSNYSQSQCSYLSSNSHNNYNHNFKSRNVSFSSSFPRKNTRGQTFVKDHSSNVSLNNHSFNNSSQGLVYAQANMNHSHYECGSKSNFR